MTRSRSQIVTLNKRGSNIKYLPYAFIELGVAMLSSVLIRWNWHLFHSNDEEIVASMLFNETTGPNITSGVRSCNKGTLFVNKGMLFCNKGMFVTNGGKFHLGLKDSLPETKKFPRRENERMEVFHIVPPKR